MSFRVSYIFLCSCWVNVITESDLYMPTFSHQQKGYSVCMHVMFAAVVNAVSLKDDL